jgi:hypothetical protein
MSAILTTLLGGLLAISGGLVGIALNDRRERTRWFRDAQLQTSTNLLSALQLLVRRMINVAYLDPSEWMSRIWTRTEFRQERASLGRMAAEYLRLARSLAGLPDIELPSIWTWDPGP